MRTADWHDPSGHALGCRIESGQRGPGALLLLNASPEPIDFGLPDGRWRVVVDSTSTDRSPNSASQTHQASYPLPGRALVLLQDDR
jgi:pullulanase/glycogen debranching enzyme